jgi:hypothetical protein
MCLASKVLPSRGKLISDFSIETSCDVSDGIQGNVYFYYSPPQIVSFLESDCSKLSYKSNLVALKKEKVEASKH